ncbi:MAG: hypothetical protein K2N61_02260 [Lachnospiraceae bacterium]|nr:hypothetical protein [Lachnospiraceae bacterium]
MNKKLFLVFILSAITGSMLLLMLVLGDYMKGPELILHNVTVELNEEVSAWSFVTECSEKNASVRYVTQPDFKVPGGQEVEIEAVDSKGRTTVKKAMLRVNIIKHGLKLEATGEEIQAADLVVNEIRPSEVSFKYKPITLNHVGEYDIALLYRGVEYTESITVIDTEAPQVVLKEEITGWQLHEFDPMTAVESISDATDVKAEIKGLLDTATAGEYPVIFVFTDEGENAAEYTVTVKIIPDTEPPVIQGASDREYYIGETISYLEGVTARDAVDGSCDVQVDNSKMDIENEGQYEILYHAKDISGNRAELAVTFTIKKMTATEERLNAKADEILAEITEPSMSLSRKAYAIYNYAYSKIQYTGTSDKSDWQAEAYRGMIDLNGDCFTYFSVCKILLNKLGIETMDITREGGSAEHYWLMVNLGTGWYHFDATRRNVYFDGFMARDEDVRAYTQQVGDNYYTYDTTKYPATPTEKFILE